ncbi:hypothetical protein J9253_05470 [Thiothrix litoralis]|uniref:Lipoprotein n=1 Tax=Thiothrix litoralis TaxID=2891210 RepID=A0ABX7WWH9_9GAMM|nr:hypothetical protein [Thiothrix litoralis]QTR47387.1 hypothetical protein J9253_05470 [Thiothrix litoralis]
MTTTMKMMAVKGLLLSATMVGVTACGTPPSSLPYDSIRLMAQPFALRPNEIRNDMLLEQRLCANSNLLMRDCKTAVRSESRLKERLQNNVRENFYDNLSGKLFANGHSSSKAHWRLKRDRVEWQYKF